jgi:Tol biopolymer transport system component
VNSEHPGIGNRSHRRFGAIGAGLVLAIGSSGTSLAIEAGAGGAETTRVSVRSGGAEGDGRSGNQSISGHGRFVAFTSNATNLVRGDTNGRSDVFVRDRKTARTSRVNLSSTGHQGNRNNGPTSISADGRFVAWISNSTNLVHGDKNGQWDVFVHDRTARKTTRVSVSSTGDAANRKSDDPSISANGRFVAFRSRARRLVRDDTNRDWDVFVRDLKTRTTTRVSVNSTGAQVNDRSGHPSISGSGRLVAFDSKAALGRGDTNGAADIYVHDRRTGETDLVSLGPDGQALGASGHPSISADGRFIAFQSPGLNAERRAEILIHDRRTGETSPIGVNPGGDDPDADMRRPSISADGRFVGFWSAATNLVPGDTNDEHDTFVYDRETGETTRVSVSSVGGQSNHSSGVPEISGDGRFVAFDSLGAGLVAGDTNRTLDVFVRGPLW